MENLQHDHHEGHQIARIPHYLQLVSLYIGQPVDDRVRCWCDADVVEQNDPASDPRNKAVNVDQIQDLLRHGPIVTVRPGQDQCIITVIVKDEDGETDPPIIGQVAEDYEKHRKTVMQGIFEEISLCSDEDVAEETTEVLAELQDVEDLHLEGGLCEGGLFEEETERITAAAQPSREVSSPRKYFVRPR